MCYGNLRGIREAGRAFAVPTYLFSGVVILMIITGLVREAFGTLGHYAYPRPGLYGIGVAHNYNALISFGLIFVLLRAFANGGSSLTGIEAVSNAVSAFKPPEGINARQVLVTEGIILGSLVAGHLLAGARHARGAVHERRADGALPGGHRSSSATRRSATSLYFLVQAATALILYTGGNTSFNGFPFLANFVAEDAFLPRWLTKRGHRLVFSNGIVVLAVLSCALLAAVGANVNNLVPFYAIGVFTAFTLAGFGMAKYHHTHKEAHWRRKLVINFSAGVTSLIVVAIFVLVKFTEGAWLVVILFAIGVPALIRLNREYGLESQVLERIGERPRPPEPPKYTRRTVYVLVDSFDLATIAALRYARSLRPTTLRAVHFVIDTQQADQLREEWSRTDRGVVLDFIDCPDRRVARAAAELASAEAAQPGDARHRRAAPAQLLPAARPAAARPHRGQDRRRGQPDPARRGDHRAVRRAEPAGGAARPAGRPRERRSRRWRRPRCPPRTRPGAPARAARPRAPARPPGCQRARRRRPPGAHPPRTAQPSAARTARSSRPAPAPPQTSRTPKPPGSSARPPPTAARRRREGRPGRRAGAGKAGRMRSRPSQPPPSATGAEAEPPVPVQETGLPPEIAEAHPSTLRALLRGRRPGRGAGGLRPAPAAAGTTRATTGLPPRPGSARSAR